jgi:CubicO group peptidase (beta-lactamase class C family)
VPWEQMMHDRIFKPFGMATAGLGPQATNGLIDAPVGHRLLGDGSLAPMFWGNGADMPTILGPAGNAHMSVKDYATWAGWNAGQGRREPHIVSPETLAFIQQEHVQTPVRSNPPPGTPTTGGYGLGWSVVQFDWTDHPLLTHNGSNSMNLARIVVDTQRDLAVIVLTNAPGDLANQATGAVMEHLYTEYAQP